LRPSIVGTATATATLFRFFFVSVNTALDSTSTIYHAVIASSGLRFASAMRTALFTAFILQPATLRPDASDLRRRSFPRSFIYL
jgi:uncharacterized membrane protein YcgQ (UPF0703/DUF1980 family)